MLQVLRGFGMVLLWAGVTWARILEERTIICEPELRARLVDGAARVFVQCSTYDDQGHLVRAAREYDVTNQLTTQQKNGTLTLLEAIPTYAAKNETIPPPAPSSTP